MKKIFIPLIIITTFLLSGCKSESEYKKEYGQVLKEISAVMQVASIYRDEVTSVWHTAIYDNRYTKYGKDEYCSDFNDALSMYFSDRAGDAEFNSFESKSKGLTDKVKTLEDYPSKLKDAYDNIVDLTAKVNHFCKNVSSPEGSLQQYSSSTYEQFEEISQQIDVLKLKYAE